MTERRLTKDGSYTLYSEAYKQTYHSIHGSKAEAEHVFLRGAGVVDRLQNQQPTNILEVGFGAGLNFFLTADLALQNNTTLHYWAFEHNLLPTEVFRSLEYAALLTHPHLIDSFIHCRSQITNESGVIKNHIHEGITLHLILDDATTAPLPPEHVQAIYLDAFSPDQNPELWTVDFLAQLYSCLSLDGKIATYSAKSLVRKNLIAAGFDVFKEPGPPGKREMLVGVKRAQAFTPSK